MSRTPRTVLPLLAAVLLTALAGCVSLNKAYPINRIPGGIAVMPLNRADYKILGDTEGSVTVKYVLGGRMPWFSMSAFKSVNRSKDEGGSASGSFLPSVPLIGWAFARSSESIDAAIYEALDKVEGADSLISVRVSSDRVSYFPLFFNEEQTTVKGKAFMIKADEGDKK